MTQVWLSLALLAAGAAGDEAANPNPWEAIGDSDGVKVLARAVPGSEVREVRAEAVVKAPWKRIWDVLDDVDHYTEFMPYVEQASIIERFPGGHYEYAKINPPLVDRRDYSIKMTYDLDEGKGIYRRSWVPANDKGPKPTAGLVRVAVNRGYWELTTVSPDSTKVVYYLYTHPGGSMPTWIVNKANSTSVPDLLKAVRQRSLNPTWKR